ncbi:DNA cytosine methyltransferase [Heyndrickxia sp. FSL K6-6286]|uniref:DNA cytosine methyltransferase n=1 Tax=Heyndrickxia sp. FSL K6-6286 TaxID=2921510 RepID=UPI003159F3E7
MNIIDLFAGAGGLSEGFRKAGFNIVAHVEMDKSACNTLRTREAYYYLKSSNKFKLYLDYLEKKISREQLYEQVPSRVLNNVIESEISNKTFSSITSIIDERLKSSPNNHIDIIIGGPPCQAYSYVGISRDPNRMKDDPRNYLYRHYIRFLKKYKPKFFIFENVKGILTAKNGTIFKSLQKSVLRAGYKIDYKVLNSKDFGVSQNRERVILIGWKNIYQFKFPEFNIVPEPVNIKQLFNDLPPLNAGESIDGLKKYRKRAKIANSFIRPQEWNILSQHITRSNNEKDLLIYKLVVDTWNKEKRLLKYNELPNELQSHKNKESFLDRFKLVRLEDISHTVVAHISKDGHYYIHPDVNQNRSISVREAARIQSFPDDFYFEDSRTAAFKQIGNAVPPLMAYHIALILQEYLNQTNKKSIIS